MQQMCAFIFQLKKKKVSGHIPEPSGDYFNLKSLIKTYNLHLINQKYEITVHMTV